MSDSYCVGVLGAGPLFEGYKLRDLRTDRDFRSQTKIEDFHISKLKTRIEELRSTKENNK